MDVLYSRVMRCEDISTEETGTMSCDNFSGRCVVLKNIFFIYIFTILMRPQHKLRNS